MLWAVVVSLVTTMPTMAIAATTTSAVTTTQEAISPRSSPSSGAHPGRHHGSQEPDEGDEAVSHTSIRCSLMVCIRCPSGWLGSVG